MKDKIPYKTYLSEDEIPTQWYNVRADMKVKPAPLLNPATMKPLSLEEMNPVFCEELIGFTKMLTSEESSICGEW